MKQLALACAAALCAASPAAAQAPDWGDAYAAASAAASACAPPLPEGRRYANIQRERDTIELLGQLVVAAPAQCPGGPAAATTAIFRLLGPIEAPAADPRLLALAHLAAERGLGMARDEALADRLGRLRWLYGDGPLDLPRWPEAARQRWLEQPATIALLEARVAQRGRLLRTPAAVYRLAELKLRRDLPGHDPAGALDLLDETALLIGDENRIRFSRLVTGGAGLPPDYERARRALTFYGSFGNQATPGLRAELLRIGTLAARTASTRAAALRILFAAAMDGHEAEVAARDTLIRRLGDIPTVPLAPADAARIAAELHREFAINLGYRREGDPALLSVIRVRALLAPDGRVAFARVYGSSGLPRRDRTILAAWAEEGPGVDLSATARGRWVWVDLPPVDPELPLHPR